MKNELKEELEKLYNKSLDLQKILRKVNLASKSDKERQYIRKVIEDPTVLYKSSENSYNDDIIANCYDQLTDGFTAIAELKDHYRKAHQLNQKIQKLQEEREIKVKTLKGKEERFRTKINELRKDLQKQYSYYTELQSKSKRENGLDRNERADFNQLNRVVQDDSYLINNMPSAINSKHTLNQSLSEVISEYSFEEIKSKYAELTQLRLDIGNIDRKLDPDHVKKVRAIQYGRKPSWRSRWADFFNKLLVRSSTENTSSQTSVKKKKGRLRALPGRLKALQERAKNVPKYVRSSFRSEGIPVEIVHTGSNQEPKGAGEVPSETSANDNQSQEAARANKPVGEAVLQKMGGTKEANGNISTPAGPPIQVTSIPEGNKPPKEAKDFGGVGTENNNSQNVLNNLLDKFDFPVEDVIDAAKLARCLDGANNKENNTSPSPQVISTLQEDLATIPVALELQVKPPGEEPNVASRQKGKVASPPKVISGRTEKRLGGQRKKSSGSSPQDTSTTGTPGRAINKELYDQNPGNKDLQGTYQNIIGSCQFSEWNKGEAQKYLKELGAMGSRGLASKGRSTKDASGQRQNSQRSERTKSPRPKPSFG